MKDLDKRIEELERAQKQALDEFKASMVKDEPKVDEWPTVGVWYYYVDAAGVIKTYSFGDSKNDKHRLKTGNIFRTKEEAEFHLVMIDLAWEIKKHSFEPDWNDGEQGKCCALWDHKSNELMFCCAVSAESSYTYFPTLEKAKQAFKDVTKEQFLYMTRKGLI